MPKKDMFGDNIAFINRGRGLCVFCLVSLLLTVNLFAQTQPIPKGFASGQASRFVLGQKSFSDITGGTSQLLLGATSGIAIADNKLILSDSSILAPPNNNRILIYNNLNALKARLPQDALPAADVVLGQVDFVSSTSGTSAQAMNEPVGVSTDGVRLYVADWGNNRVLIYRKIPETSGAPADVVVGQKDFNSSTAAAGPQGLRRPNGVFSDGSRLLIADTLNNRVLIYTSIPTTNGASANIVLGQPDFNGLKALPAANNTLSAPMSATTDGRRLVVTDLVNNRVLIYNSFPTQSGAAADVVVGQADFSSSAPGNTATSLNFPRYAYSDGTRLVIVDTGNNRILIYNQIPTQNGAPADLVIGQTDFYGLLESCASSNIAVPYAVASDGDMLYVSDGLNRRVLGFRPGAALVNMYGVVNTASFSILPQTQSCQVSLPEPPVAPGGIASIFGTNMADSTAQADSLPLPTSLGGIRVKFNGITAPLFSVSPNQIDVQVPFELAGYSASLEIEKDTSAGTIVSAAAPVGLANGAPGIFTQDGSGKGLGVVFHADSSPVTADSPALPGEAITAYATGLGTVDNAMMDGAAAVFGATGSVTIGGTTTSAGQTATVIVQGVSYSYTTVSGDTLNEVTTNLAALINNSDPLVSATADTTNEVVNLLARIPGDTGLNITMNASVPAGSTLTVIVENPIAVPGNVYFGGTVADAQTITITLGGTPYTYATNATDTMETVIDGLVNLINADPNVVATADVPDSLIHLDLLVPTSNLTVVYSVDSEPPGTMLTAITDGPKLTAGVANATNTVSATIGKSLSLVPGSILFGGTAEPGQTVTVTLDSTPYTYTTTSSDTLESIVNAMTKLLTSDANVTATADTVNIKIDLALKSSGSTQQITFTTTQSAGATLIVFPQSTTTTGSEAATVNYARLVAGSVGLYQVNFTVPTDQAVNPAQILTLTQNLIVFGSTTGTNIVSNDVTFPIGAPSP